MSSKTSMQDIADHLGISKNAVSLALGGKPGVSEELRARVLEAAKLLNYQLEAKKASPRHLLVLLPESSRDAAAYELVRCIEQQAAELGCTAAMCSVSPALEAELRLPSLYHELNAAGVLLVGAFSPAYVQGLMALRVPLVSVDHAYAGLALDAVVTDQTEAAYAAAMHLIRLGHRRIGFIGQADRLHRDGERWLGWRLALADSGLPIDPALAHTAELPLHDAAALARALLAWVGSLAAQPTAWLCASDRIAIALVQVLGGLGLSVPADVSVTGFDNLEAGALLAPRLTTVQPDLAQLAGEAAELLLRRAQHGDGAPVKRAVYARLVTRESTAAAPALG